MKQLSRHLVMVYRKQPLLDWVISVSPSLHKWTWDTLSPNPNTYVIEIEGQEPCGEAVKKHFLKIFEEELRNVACKELWPKDRSYSLFSNWFFVKHHARIAETVPNS